MIENTKALTSTEKHLCWIWEKFKFSDVKNTGDLNKSELKRFFQFINIEVTKQDIEDKWLEYARDENGFPSQINWANLKQLYGTMLIPDYIKTLFKN